MISVVFLVLVRHRSYYDNEQIGRSKGIVNRFRVKLVKIIKDVNDDYAISPEVSLHWGYGLVENELNRDRLIEKAKIKYHNGGGKTKAAEYYKDDKKF